MQKGTSSMSGEIEEQKVTTATELAEAFGLGSTLSRLDTTLKFVAESTARTEKTSAETLTTVGTMKTDAARQAEQIKTLFTQDESMRAELAEIPKTYATKAEHAELKAEVASARLSWAKVGALIIGLGGVVALAQWIASL